MNKMRQDSQPLIDIHNFSKYFGDFQAVRELSFEVQKGEMFGFLGRNGAGKTTTLRTLLNIYQPDEGHLHIQGTPFSQHRVHEVGYLPEERGLYTRASVVDTVQYFARLRGLDSASARERTQILLERFELQDVKKKRIQDLSSGMQQKIQIIISIIHKPRVLVLDEPFRGLDPVNRQLAFDILSELNEAGTTILFSSHQISEIENLCDRIIMISKGEKKAYGRIQEIKSLFEPRFIHIHYEGQLPALDVEWCEDQGNQAELKFKPGTNPQEILKTLVDSQVRVEKFEISRPSLNQIFLELCAEKQTGSAITKSRLS
jgi:ABC-2 type transport system ATP-binding protein